MSEQAAAATVGAWPDPLVGTDGRVVEGADAWVGGRRRELLSAFEDEVYGVWPSRPRQSTVRSVVEDLLWDGAGRLQELELTTVGPDAVLRVLLITPTTTAVAGAPAFLAANFSGNHRLLDHPGVAVSTASPGAPGEQADRRGAEAAAWDLRATVAAGYAVATFAKDEVLPDDAGPAAGLLAGFARDGRAAGAISVWAWAYARVLDLLADVAAVDERRVLAVGHSRLGKAALWAGANDERFAAVVPSQAGAGGSSPSRTAPELAAPGPDGRPRAETVDQITRRFPHWFSARYAGYADRVAELPVEQHELVALCAPRPVLLSNAEDDEWADPVGQFEVLRHADPVYRLVGGSGLEVGRRPGVGESSLGRLGYALRPGGHSMSAADWATWRDFADRWV